jgi:hypothetical protein
VKFQRTNQSSQLLGRFGFSDFFDILWELPLQIWESAFFVFPIYVLLDLFKVLLPGRVQLALRSGIIVLALRSLFVFLLLSFRLSCNNNLLDDRLIWLFDGWDRPSGLDKVGLPLRALTHIFLIRGIFKSSDTGRLHRTSNNKVPKSARLMLLRNRHEALDLRLLG